MWYDSVVWRVFLVICAIVGFSVIAGFVAGGVCRAVRAAFRMGRGE